jgi:hypothetical protein
MCLLLVSIIKALPASKGIVPLSKNLKQQFWGWVIATFISTNPVLDLSAWGSIKPPGSSNINLILLVFSFIIKLSLIHCTVFGHL